MILQGNHHHGLTTTLSGLINPRKQKPRHGGEPGLLRFHWGAEPGFRRLAEPRDGQGKPSLPIYIYQPHEG
jgi:hypothetical protein